MKRLRLSSNSPCASQSPARVRYSAFCAKLSSFNNRCAAATTRQQRRNHAATAQTRADAMKQAPAQNAPSDAQAYLVIFRTWVPAWTSPEPTGSTAA